MRSLPAGSSVTMVFLGINSGQGGYLNTRTAQTFDADYSGKFGMDGLNAGNTVFLPNANFALNAALGEADQDQVDTANAIYGDMKSLNNDLTARIATHSNGVNGGGQFAAGKTDLGNALVIAPNTGSTHTMSNIVNASTSTTILSSPNDNRLALAPLASKSPSVWQRIFGGNPRVKVVQTDQTGHGVQCYAAAADGKDSTQVPGCK